jgi:hypothetical protein
MTAARLHPDTIDKLSRAELDAFGAACDAFINQTRWADMSDVSAWTEDETMHMELIALAYNALDYASACALARDAS